MPLLAVTFETVDVLAGESGVTLRKLPTAPVIPMEAVVELNAPLLLPYTN